MTGFQLTVPGPPRPAGRPRFARIGNGVRTYPDPKDAPAKHAVQTAWRQAGSPVVAGPYTVQIRAMMPRPKSHWCKKGLSAAGRRAVSPPHDVDNVAKLVLDALVQVGAIPDDRHCHALTVSKHWAGRDQPGLTAVWVG